MAASIAVSVTVDVNTKNRFKNRIKRIDRGETFEHFLSDKFSSELSDDYNIQKVYLWPISGEKDKFCVDSNDTIENAMEFGNIKFVHYILTSETELTPVPSTSNKSAFDVLMQGRQPKLLKKLENKNKKTDLHNKVLDDMQQDTPILSGHVSDNAGHEIFMRFTDALWYLDGRQKIVKEAVSSRGSKITPIPSRFEEYEGWQDWRTWKKRPRMEREKCEEFAKSLLSVLEKQAIRWPIDWQNDIVELASTFSTYADYLSTSVEKQQERQLLMTPVRQLSTNAVGRFWPSIAGDKQVHPNLLLLSDAMENEEFYEPVLIDSHTHFPPTLKETQKYYHMQNISLKDPVQEISYDPGGGSSVLHFLYRVPENSDDDERTTMALRILTRLEPDIPKYHTRAMRRVFYSEMSNLRDGDLPPHLLRHVYKTLTNDCSKDESSGEIDERVRVAVATEDPDMILDMRHLNPGRPGDTFQLFFDELCNKIEEITAADDRRHGIAHMSEFLSIPDMIKQVSESLPPDTPVPSEATVLYSFAPPNTHVQSAQYYTGKIKLKHTVQRRQLRAFHTDAHWCNALYRYVREAAIKDRESSIMLSCDDKAKLDYGEPGYAISSGVRGKKSIVPVTTLLGALDHDVNQKGSLTPSVSLQVDIPTTITETFYRGQVVMSLKESIFEPSSSFRFGTELCQTIKTVNPNLDEIKSLFLLTDGGPEHRVNFDSVKIPLIVTFLDLKLEMLVAIRTAPGQSYRNPVERIMSVINIGFQNVALERNPCDSDHTIQKCKGLDDLRKHPEIKDDFRASIAPMREQLENRLKRLSLKDVPFKVIPPATESQIDAFVDQSAEIDDDLPDAQRQHKLTKADLKSKHDYQDFLKKHCKEGLYMFQVKQCSDESCCTGEGSKRDWVPYPMDDEDKPGHYKSFEDSVGRDTSEEDIPSLKLNIRKVTQEQQGCPASMMTGQNVRRCVNCSNCNKVRCIYAKKALSEREMRSLNAIVRTYDYMCGCLITPDVSTLTGTVFTRLEMTCQTPIEWSFYASKQSKLTVCANCGGDGGIVDNDLKDIYQTVLPMCAICSDKGATALTRQPRQTAAAKRAAKPAANSKKSKKSKK